jgi:hypothetical protein
MMAHDLEAACKRHQTESRVVKVDREVIQWQERVRCQMDGETARHSVGMQSGDTDGLRTEAESQPDCSPRQSETLTR